MKVLVAWRRNSSHFVKLNQSLGLCTMQRADGHLLSGCSDRYKELRGRQREIFLTLKPQTRPVEALVLHIMVTKPSFQMKESSQRVWTARLSLCFSLLQVKCWFNSELTVADVQQWWWSLVVLRISRSLKASVFLSLDEEESGVYFKTSRDHNHCVKQDRSHFGDFLSFIKTYLKVHIWRRKDI